MPLAPDFVLELMSPSDQLKATQAKMREYKDNGVKLGWLINPQQQEVEIYRLGKPLEIVVKPLTLSREDTLPESIIELDLIWKY